MKKIHLLYIILLLITGAMPAFGGVDKMAFQWLYLGVINLVYIITLITSKEVKKLKINRSILAYGGFIIVAVISSLGALNKVESYIEISRYLVVFISFILGITALKKSNINEIKNAVKYVLLIEAVLFYAILWYYFKNFETVHLKGIASNINIQAFSIIIKIPWLIFIKSDKKQWIQNIALWLGVSIVFLISSRASLLSLGIITIAYLIWNKEQLITRIKKTSVLLLPGIVWTLLIINPLLKTGEKLKNISVINESSLTRLAFYKEALLSIIAHPFLGIGTGNWKLYGIEAHKELVNGYTIPYHAHNDFLQIASETGIIGAVLYLGIFLFAFYHIKQQWLNIKYNSIIKAIVLSLLVYLIDANLNFPISRPVIQVQLVLVLALLYSAFPNKTRLSIKINKPLLGALALIILGTSFYSFKVYESFKYQDYLLKDFGDQRFDTPIEIIESIDDQVPSIGATALPIKAIKANYYQDDSVVNRLLDLAIKDNPFIKYPQALKSIRFRTQGKLDSSLVYAKEAFYGLPRNELHIINYLSILTDLKDSIEIDKVYDKVKSMDSKNVLNAYLLTQLTIERSKSPEIEAVFNQAVVRYPEDERFKLYKLRMTNGDSIISEANTLFLEGESLFNQGEFIKSAETYLKASKLLPEDPAYLENAGHAYYMQNKNNLAMGLFDSVIQHYRGKSGKAEYLKGLMLFETKNQAAQACELFNAAIKKGNQDAQRAKQLICRN